MVCGKRQLTSFELVCYGKNGNYINRYKGVPDNDLRVVIPNSYPEK